MLNTDIPSKLVIPFGNNAGAGYIRPIPVASQIGVHDGYASFHDGFVPLNATPIGAGGIPPDIKDMNGILFDISAWARWVCAGGPLYFDSVWAASVGGYPKGAIVQSSTTVGLLFASKVNSNTGDPEGAGAASWQALVPVPATLAELVTGTDAVKYVTPATLAGLRANSADVLAGTDTAKYITPAAFYGARASNADFIAGTNDHKYLTPAAMAAGNSVGIIYHPGGIIEQYGVNIGSRGEGFYTFAFPSVFPTACDHVLTTTIQNVNDFGHVHDIWASWYQAGTSASTLGITVQGTGGGPSPNMIDGFSWRAMGH